MAPRPVVGYYPCVGPFVKHKSTKAKRTSSRAANRKEKRYVLSVLEGAFDAGLASSARNAWSWTLTEICTPRRSAAAPGFRRLFPYCACWSNGPPQDLSKRARKLHVSFDRADSVVDGRFWRPLTPHSKGESATRLSVRVPEIDLSDGVTCLRRWS